MNAQVNARWWEKSWLAGALLIAAIVLAYQPAWNAGFIWDDDDYVTHNPLLTAPDGLQRIWFSTDSPSQYFPLVYTTFRAEHALWGLNSTGYHWVNILIHALNALLVWRLLAKLEVPGAWLGAAIFSLHPVQVESVAWISELKNVQSLFFFLLSLLAWVEFVEARRGWGAYALSLLFCALSLFSKTTACTLPAALLLILWLRKRPIGWVRLAQVVPYGAMGVAMGMVSMWWERNHQGTQGEIYAMSWIDRLLVATRALWFYAGKLLWPHELTFNYPLWKIDAGDPLAYGWLMAGIGLCAVIYFLRRVAGRGVEVATVFYVAMLSPLVGFIMLYTFKYTFVADHYQYVAVIAPAALAAAAVFKTLSVVENQRRWLKPVLCGVLATTLAVLTWRQSRMYDNLEILWRTTIARNPESYMGHNNLGAILLGKGQIDQAIGRFERALEILPDHGNAHGNLGNALLQKGRIDDALDHYRRAVACEPGVAKAHSDLSFGLLQAGRFDDAILHGRKALELQPAFAEAHNNLGWGLLQSGRADEAFGHFQEALKLQPESADTHYNLGTAYLHKGGMDAAVAHFQKALEIRPGFAKANNNLGTAFFQSGRIDEAIAQFGAALKADPGNVEAGDNFGRSLMQAGRLDEAIVHFERVVRARPDRADAEANLAVCFFQKGEMDAAIAHFGKSVEIQPANPEVQNNLGWALLHAGRVDDAIGRFRTVLQIEPDFVLAHNNLALAYLEKGRARDAVNEYEAFLAKQPDHAPVLGDLAWIFATWPDAVIRDRFRALELAQRANQLSGDREPIILRTLAAAQAENGQFEGAASTAQRALQAIESPSGQQLAHALQSQIETYRAGQPFRQAVSVGTAPAFLRRTEPTAR